MSKEDIMNKISFALKDPILQMGFEVICSKLSRLEKENAELKERNAELAGQKASLERWFGEAKAIIRKYYNYNHICGYSYEAIDKQAEQFLKEV